MAPLTADAKRLRTIVISFPLFVVTSAILYRRTYMGEEQRRAPQRKEDAAPTAQDSILHRGKAVGTAPWIRQGEHGAQDGEQR